ncbi:MAG TPA: hypothetical protein VNI54_14125 [Thermoanaerobaculia bacterium]|nr:hypothetical protein [Thermoanaerobaculia bacterium]
MKTLTAVLGLLFCLAGEAHAQFCASGSGCLPREDCKKVGEATYECSYRCYTDASCRCWYVKCYTIEYRNDGGRMVTDRCLFVNPGLFCAPQRCLDPTNADCDDVSEDNSGTPIVIDAGRNGIRLTAAADGVAFDLNADGEREHLAWTTADSDDVWLALDRNGNGTIDNGAELFGDATPQPAGGARHGYRALAVLDDDRNEEINAADPVWSLLRLWRDANHDGVSQAWELSARTGRHPLAVAFRHDRQPARSLRKPLPLPRAGRWRCRSLLLRRHCHAPVSAQCTRPRARGATGGPQKIVAVRFLLRERLAVRRSCLALTCRHLLAREVVMPSLSPPACHFGGRVVEPRRPRHLKP